MKESKLIRLLRKLDKNEIKRLRDFVNSPYYNKNSKYCMVFEELIKYHPDFDEKEFSEEIVYKNSLGQKEYDYFTMKNILSDLNDLALKFLLVEFTGEKGISDELKITQMLREKEIFDEYKSKLNKLKKKMEKEYVDGEYYYKDKLSLLDEEISSLSIFDPNTRFDLKQEELDTLINYSIIRILKAYCSLSHELKQNNYPFEFTMMDTIINYLKGRSFEDIPIIDMYKNVLFLQQTGEYKYYKILTGILDKHFYTLNYGDIYMLYVYMRSFTVVSYNLTMEPKYLRDCFELDKLMHERGRNTLGKILYPDFIAMVKTAAMAKEFEWAEQFILQMKSEILADVKSDVLNFSYGFIEYMKGNLPKALELIYKTNFNIFILQIQVYTLLVRIYYEIGYYEDALNLIKSAKGYLKKEIALGDMQRNLNNFLKYTERMIKLKLSVDPKSEKKFIHDKLKKDITAMKYNYFGVKAWLLVYINLLKS